MRVCTDFRGQRRVKDGMRVERKLSRGNRKKSGSENGMFGSMSVTRIAQELHDTLLQSFLSASLHLNVASDQVPAIGR